MKNHVLNNKDEYPSEEIIFSHIGKSKAQWEKLFAVIGEDYPELASEWRFYKDGKSWLMKTTRKSKTIFWLSVWEGYFRVAFYFGDKAEPLILESGLSDSLKDSFTNGKRYGKIRGIKIDVRKDSDIAEVKKLIEIKLIAK